MIGKKKNEEWLPVIGFEKLYMISNHGRLKALPKWRKNRFNGYISKEKIIRPKFGPKSYCQYQLSDNYSQKLMRRARLVAIHFIPNPENKEQVNHKDGNRENDYFENLEWVTQSENIQHSYDFLGRKAAYKGKFGRDHNQSIPVVAIKPDGTELLFESKTECGIYLRTTVQNVFRAIRDNGSCKGHKIKLA